MLKWGRGAASSTPLVCCQCLYCLMTNELLLAAIALPATPSPGCSGGPIPLTQEGALSAEAGFAVRMERSAAGTGMPAVTHFLPPSLVW